MKNFAEATIAIAIWMFLVISPLRVFSQSQSSAEARGPDPIIDIDKPQPDEAAADIRARRNERHNLPGGRPLTEPRQTTVEETIGSDFQESLPAFPLAHSDAVVTGTLTKATGHLSEDRSMVYSEFRMSIIDVLKSSASPALIAGQNIDVERLGGAVRFPSGRIWHFRISQQGFPRVGGRYVLFLKCQAQTDDFYLVTGYEIKTGKIVPLDGVGFTSNPKLRLASWKYNGVDANAFFTDLRNAINGGGERWQHQPG